VPSNNFFLYKNIASWIIAGLYSYYTIANDLA
jgi:hypothetical protein